MTFPDSFKLRTLSFMSECFNYLKNNNKPITSEAIETFSASIIGYSRCAMDFKIITKAQYKHIVDGVITYGCDFVVELLKSFLPKQPTTPSYTNTNTKETIQ